MVKCLILGPAVFLALTTLHDSVGAVHVPLETRSHRTVLAGTFSRAAVR
jgi:hypothetical protein